MILFINKSIYKEIRLSYNRKPVISPVFFKIISNTYKGFKNILETFSITAFQEILVAFKISAKKKLVKENVEIFFNVFIQVKYNLLQSI